jgi:hypothetical protein
MTDDIDGVEATVSVGVDAGAEIDADRDPGAGAGVAEQPRTNDETTRTMGALNQRDMTRTS